MAATGHTDDSLLTQQYRPEYVFWAIDQWPFVFAQPLRLQQPVSVTWEVYSNGLDWAGNAYALTHVGVSRWDAARSPPYVCALAFKTPNASAPVTLIAHIRQFDGVNGAFLRGSKNVTLLAGSRLQVVGLTHTASAVGSAAVQPGGLFYIAYNAGGLCGGLLMVSPISLA